MTSIDTTKLQSAILEILEKYPQGIEEYNLLTQLKDAGFFPDRSFIDYLPLFQMHFILFNCLYQLRNNLWQEQKGNLEISSIKITLKPYQQGESAIAQYDPLSEYYLNWDNLEETNEGDVAELLGRFWAKFLAGEGRESALTVMKLEDPIDYQSIKKQYRMLVKNHHPDRGGDKQRLQEINEAMEVLKKHHEK